MADFKREPALRLFASELAKTTEELERSPDDKFATAYAISPTGAKINRIFHVGVLTEIEEKDNGFITGRIVDPTGAVHIRAGTYQPELSATMRQLEDKLPMFVAVTGKLNIYKPEEGQVYVSIRPESLVEVTGNERDLWLEETMRQTLDRIKNIVTLPDKIPPEIYEILDNCYSHDLNKLKDIVRLAAGLEETSLEYAQDDTGNETGDNPATDTGMTETGSAKPEDKKADTAPPAPGKPAVECRNEPAKKKESTNETAGEVHAGITETGRCPGETKVDAAHALLTELCSSSENGTVGANQFLDRLKEARIASAEKTSTVVKAMFDRGMAYEPQLGRLKAVV